MRSTSQLVLAVSLTLVLYGPGCGPDGRRVRAEEAVSAAVALDEADRTSGGEDVAIASALERSHRWLDQSEESVELWGSSGSLAYETAAACLGSALGQLRDAMISAGVPLPERLEEAEALVLDAAERPCAERVAPAVTRSAAPEHGAAGDGAAAASH